MKIDYVDGLFVAVIPFEQRKVFQDAGWAWDQNVRKWATSSPEKASHFHAFSTDAASNQIEAWHRSSNKMLEASYAEASDFPCPVPPTEKLDPFQVAGVEFMSKRDKTLLADPPGLGKTVQVAAWLNLYPGSSVLVVCPSHLTVHWVRTLAKWNTIGMTFDRARSIGTKYKDAEGKRKIKMVQTFPATTGVVVSFDNLKAYHKQLREKTWDILVVDEAHNALNPATTRFAELYGRKRGNSKRKLLKTPPILWKKAVWTTGTPVPSRPDQMFPLLKQIDPEGLGSDWLKYANRYCNATEGFFGLDTSGSSNLDELQALMRMKFMIRRPKSVLRLKEMTRQIVELPSDGLEAILFREQSAFDKIRNALLAGIADPDEVKEVPDVDILGKLGQVIKERFGHLDDLDYKDRAQYLNDNGQLPFEEFSKARMALALGKIPMAAEHISNLLDNGEKVVCYVVHKEVASKLKELFPGCAIVVGGMTTKAKQDEVDRFQTDPTCRLLVGNIKAAGTGYTMTEGTRGVMVEYTWVPSDITQAEDRIHRRGKEGDSHWDHLVVEGSMDARFIHTFITKSEVLEQMFDSKIEDLNAAKALANSILSE